MVVRRNGWIYVYLSNQSNQDVFFDNLVVNLKHGPLVEQKDYYSFGMENPALSTQSIKQNYYANRTKYGGKELQNKEFTDGTGLEDYDYGARLYDPQLGRWHAVDRHAAKYENFSLYGFVFNNPINKIDPNGMDTHLSGVAAQEFAQQIQDMGQHSAEVYDHIAQFYKNENGGESDNNFTIKAVLPVYESITPDIYNHINSALSQGYPQMLTRGVPANTETNRYNAMKEIPRSSRPLVSPYILSRDEYPFASTVEGGLAVSTAWVPVWEQNIQSAQISSIYSYVKPGDRFIVDPISKDIYNNTEAPAWYSMPYWKPSEKIIHTPGNINPLPQSPKNTVPDLIPLFFEGLRTVPAL